MIVLVDYGMGNLRSVQKAFEISGAKARITSSKNDLKKASKIVLPGVGSFSAAMGELEKRDLIDVLKEKISQGTPVLGLCLGLQILLSESEESIGKCHEKGLGIIPGIVRKFRGDMKIPHMGWNTLKIQKKDSPFFKNIHSGDYFYFVHSYYAQPQDASCVAAGTPYGKDFCSAISKDNIFATQFHPEKSQALGLQMIQNFIRFKQTER